MPLPTQDDNMRAKLANLNNCAVPLYEAPPTACAGTTVSSSHCQYHYVIGNQGNYNMEDNISTI